MRPDNEHNFSPGKGIQIPESAKCLLLESGIWKFYLVESGILDLEFIIQLKETGMALTIGVRNPSSFDKESGIQNPRLSWIPLHGANNYVVIFKESQ